MISLLTVTFAVAAQTCSLGIGSTDDDSLLFRIEDSRAQWDATIANVSLVDDPISQLDYKRVMSHVVDSAAQNWQRVGRSRAKIGLSGFTAGLVWGADGTSAIVSEACPADPNSAPAQAWPDILGGSECDLVFRRGACAPFNLATTSSATGLAGSFERTLSHEMGHCIGLAHPANSNTSCEILGSSILCGCQVGACGGVGVPPVGGCTDGMLMCQDSCGKRVDLPHPHDQTAIIHGHYGSATSGSAPRRKVLLRTRRISTTNTFQDMATIDTGVSSRFLPAIQCRTGVASPQCFMARVFDDTSVRFDRLTFPGVGPTTVTLGTTTVTNARTGYPADLAISESSNVAVVVISPNDPTSVVGQAQVLRFNLSQNQFLGTVTVPVRTTMQPRVVFVRGLDRFVVAVYDGSRQARFFISTDGAGNGPYSELTRTGTFDASDSSFDLHCPLHVAPSSGDNLCRFVNTKFGALERTGRTNACNVTFSTTGVTITGCSGVARDSSTTWIASLSDYGTGTPNTQRQSRSWLWSLSEVSPHIVGANSILELYSYSSFSLSGLNLVTLNSHGIDFGTCSSLNGTDAARSYFGGLSLDYCEGCERIVSAGWGDFVSPASVGGSTKCR